MALHDFLMQHGVEASERLTAQAMEQGLITAGNRIRVRLDVLTTVQVDTFINPGKRNKTKPADTEITVPMWATINRIPWSDTQREVVKLLSDHYPNGVTFAELSSKVAPTAPSRVDSINQVFKKHDPRFRIYAPSKTRKVYMIAICEPI